MTACLLNALPLSRGTLAHCRRCTLLSRLPPVRHLPLERDFQRGELAGRRPSLDSHEICCRFRCKSSLNGAAGGCGGNRCGQKQLFYDGLPPLCERAGRLAATAPSRRPLECEHGGTGPAHRKIPALQLKRIHRQAQVLRFSRGFQRLNVDPEGKLVI